MPHRSRASDTPMGTCAVWLFMPAKPLSEGKEQLICESSLIPVSSLWAESKRFLLIMLLDTTKLFCIKELYLFVNTHVNRPEGIIHIFKAYTIIFKDSGFCMAIDTLGIKMGLALLSEYEH